MRSLIFLVCLSVLGASSNWADSDDEQAELAELDRHITQLQEALQADRGSLGELELKLAEDERAVSRLAVQLRSLSASLNSAQQALDEILDTQRTAQERLRQTELEMASIFQQAWRNRNSNGLAALLSADPAAQQRQVTHFEILNAAQQEAFLSYQNELTELQEIERQRIRNLSEVSQRRSEATNGLTELRVGQAQRERSRAELAQRISASGTQLEQLSAERAQLEQVVRELSRAIASLQPPASRIPFAELQGKLPNPVAGSVIDRFGQTRQGSIKWQGHRFLARMGDDVSAVAYGRVVYANWLSGQGLLIALDHGDGYLTLYAHNQSLLRSVGEWVEAGEIIATIGNSGGLDETALYFEIRHNGKAINPQRWLSN
ncbi:peptidoglycan DD-metalloendopeptidase family protein [uncultured Umboniibacter sp.]|uniref:murein hydrolase activator EnvC family protein n=1 Tax=uncultured Umboniibacter sp. TaxID=1798917 RepID=UPI00262C2FE7|nr:peptidoglycan DD-metalloendopeptidase family protein [uncultured Umboniibacter sp.]